MFRHLQDTKIKIKFKSWGSNYISLESTIRTSPWNHLKILPIYIHHLPVDSLWVSDGSFVITQKSISR